MQDKSKYAKGTEWYFTKEWRDLKYAVLRRDRWECQWCHGRATSADHVVPRRHGGADHMSNLKATCKSCNEFFHGLPFPNYEKKLAYWRSAHDEHGNLKRAYFHTEVKDDPDIVPF